MRYGIPKVTALKIVSQAVLGTTRLLETGEHPRPDRSGLFPRGHHHRRGVRSAGRQFESAVLAAVRESYEKDKAL